MRSKLLITAAGAMMLAGCAKEGTDGIPQADGTISAIRVSADGFFNAYGADSRTADNGYNTTFVLGDKIGLTAVRDGMILHDNIQLTYDGTAWGLPSPADLWYYAGATYIAYYPYSAAMSGKMSTDEIEAAFSPKQNQSAYTDHTLSDLMVWSGAAAGTTTAPVLNISLAHAMAMIIVEPRGAGYTTPEGATWVWHDDAGYDAPSDVRITVTVGGMEYTPYTMLEGGNSTAVGATPGESDGTYRILVKPRLTVDIAVKYETMDAVVEWDAEMAAPAAGKYAKYNVSLPATLPSGTRVAAVGDYYMGRDADGKTILLPNAMMTEALKPSCVGVVAITGGATGKIIHKEESGPLAWSTEEIVTGATSLTNGKDNTDIVTALGSYSDLTYPVFAWCVAKGEGWYLPARNELIAVYSGSGNLNAALTAVGGTAYSRVMWSSSELNNNIAIAFTDPSVFDIATKSGNSQFVRALLAF